MGFTRIAKLLSHEYGLAGQRRLQCSLLLRGLLQHGRLLRGRLLRGRLLQCSLLVGCASVQPVCFGTCDKDSDCGSTLTCDQTIGYCVQNPGDPANVQACELEVDERWVCAEHEVQLPLANESSHEDLDTQSVQVRGVPDGVSVVGNELRGRFAKGEHQVAWGNGPGRRVLDIHATTQCPALDTSSEPAACTGRELNATLQATGGKGDITWSLVGDSKGFSLDENGTIRGVVTSNSEVTVAMQDERNVRVESALVIEAVAGCPAIQTRELPASCAASVFEWQIDVTGANVAFREPTVISADPARDLEKLRLTINTRGDKGYRLRATPESDAIGLYTVGLIADNDKALDQVEVPFEVKSCATENRVVCCGEEVTVPLGPGVWSLTSPGNNPMRSNAAILGDNQLNFARNGLGNGSYTLNLNNPKGETESLLLLLSGPGEEGCDVVETDGGTDTNTSDPDASGLEPVALPRLQDGCVGKPYRAIYDWGSPLETTPTLSPNIGLTAKTSGSSIILSGTPTTALPEPTLSLTADGQTQDVQVVIRSDCGFAYTAYSAEDGNQLYVGSLESGVPSVRAVTEFVAPTYEVAGFRISPSGERLLAWTRSDNQAASNELFIVDPSGTQPANPILVSSEPITVIDAAWSPNGSQISVIYDTVSADGGSSARYFSVFALMANEVARTHRLPGANLPVWPNENAACVAHADNLELTQPDLQGTTCLLAGTQTATQSLTPVSENVQARTFDSGLLMLSPDYQEMYYWRPGVLNVMHFAHFAAPNGQYVGTLQTESGSVLHISKSSDDTYETLGSVGSVPGCDEVVAWSYGGKKLACTSASELMLVSIDNAELTLARVPNTQGHDLVRRKIFTSDNRYYVFTHPQGSIGFVDMTRPAEQWQVQTFDLGASSPPDFASLEPAGNGSKIIVQHESLDAIELPHGQNPTPRQTRLSRSMPPAESVGCVRNFQTVGYTNWCGGDDVRDRFLPSTDGLSLLYVAASGKLVFTDTVDGNMFTELEGGLTLCDPDANSCDTFAFGIK